MALWIKKRVFFLMKSSLKGKNGRKAPIKKSLVLFSDRMVANCPMKLKKLYQKERGLSIKSLPSEGRWPERPEGCQ